MNIYIPDKNYKEGLEFLQPRYHRHLGIWGGYIWSLDSFLNLNSKRFFSKN